MIRFLLIAFLFLISAKGFTQSNPSPANPVEEGKVFTFVEQQPEFPGGEEELMKFIKKNVHYPKKEKRKGIQGMVVITFIVDKYGKVREAKVLKDVENGPGFGKEALRVVNLMPDWKPATMNGKFVSVQYNLPLSFSLSKPKSK